MSHITGLSAALFTALLSIAYHPPVLEAQTSGDSGYSRYSSGQEYVVVGERAVLYTSPSLKSHAIGEFRSRAVIAPISIKNGWAEVDRPEHGFVTLDSLTEVAEPQENGKDSFRIDSRKTSDQEHSTTACTRERELEEKVRDQDERIRELERQLDTRNSDAPYRNSPNSNNPPLGAVSSGLREQADTAK
jgi:hypothetical protein